MHLTFIEIKHLLDCIKRAHGVSIGYADDAQVARIQGKLSIALEARVRLGDPDGPLIPLPPRVGPEPREGR
jgi:hypothetical protein